MSDTLAAVRGIENLTPAGRRATVDVAKSLGIDADWLATVMSFESAGTFSPSKKNAAGSGATGVIQFLPSTAGRLGYTISQIASMSQETQIRGPVYQYLKGHGKLKSLDDVYLAVFYPAAIGQSNDWVVASRGSKVYEQNKGFDTSDSGVIRRGDIVGTIRGVYNASQSKPRVDVPAAELWRYLLYFSAFGITAWFIVNWGTRNAASRVVKREFHITNPTAVKLLG